MRILKSYGTNGGVIISAPGVDIEERKSEPAFIEFDGLPVPFFIEEITPRGGAKYFVKLEDIDTLDQAEELVGREMTFDEDGEEEGEDIVGYTLFDQNGRKIGEITAFEDIPGNPCVEIVGGALIPCPDECILDVDPRKRTIKLQIAEGLI
jgi:16S rRNA processing protein RimM